MNGEKNSSVGVPEDKNPPPDTKWLADSIAVQLDLTQFKLPALVL